MKNHDWFEEARFGFFIHWGVYAGADGNEWIKSDKCLTNEEYQKYIDYFDADRFQPEKWAEIAEACGMRYMIFTAKHHDGFCMFNTEYTDYNSVHFYGRDYLREVIDAFRERNFRIGIYYSLPDWHHPNYCIDARHPLRATRTERDTKPYTEYLHAQVRELMSHYGTIDILWFDGSYSDTKHIWDSDRLAVMIRTLQPSIKISRLPGNSDFATPEQTIPPKGIRSTDDTPARWEGCQVINGQWGYSTVGVHWREPEQLVRMLVKHVSRGGNMLLNAGPTGRGEIDPRSAKVMRQIGEWMEQHGKSIRNCTQAPFQEPEGCRYTWNSEQERLYLHLFSWDSRQLFLHGLSGRVAYARFLHDHSEVPRQTPDPKNINAVNAPAEVIQLTLPVEKPDVLLPVIELILINISR